MSNGLIRFSNNGQIDSVMWQTFGVSVKGGENPIGQFGTGLKYAIAVLMREGRSLSIKSGGDEFVFGTQAKTLRGKDFEQITCNGEPLPFTTHLGDKWKLWQAYRELYSNCLDERGWIGDGGDTVVSAALADIYHGDVFLNTENRKMVSSSSRCEVYNGDSEYLYFRGIRAMDLPTRSRYTYNILDADLTEDRTLKYQHQVFGAIADAVMLADCPDFLTDFLTQTKGSFEETVDFDYARLAPCRAAVTVYSNFRRSGCFLHPGFAKKAIQHMGFEAYDTVSASEFQSRVIEKASEFCKKIGHPIRYPILVATNLGDDTLGLADKKSNNIYLSERVLTQGTKQVASTLLEENLHLAEGLRDCTYPMQSYLFDQIISMGERLTGEIL